MCILLPVLAKKIGNTTDTNWHTKFTNNNIFFEYKVDWQISVNTTSWKADRNDVEKDYFFSESDDDNGKLNEALSILCVHLLESINIVLLLQSIIRRHLRKIYFPNYFNFFYIHGISNGCDNLHLSLSAMDIPWNKDKFGGKYKI